MGEIGNMNSLVIDTATTRTSCGLVIDGALKYSGFHDGATEHAEALPKLVAAALQVTHQIDEVIVGMGPGPFTGLRVGITFAQTFATARDIPWIGVCSLDGISVTETEYLVATDARRNEIYWARYKSGKRIAGPNVGSINEIPENSEEKYGFGFTESLFPDPLKLFQIARLENFTEPIYLRRPDAQPTNERR